MRNGFGMNEREQPYVQVKCQPKMRNMQMGVWSESEINGQKRLPASKMF